MELRAGLLFALIVSIRASLCIDADSCPEDLHGMSLLQTELHVSKARDAIQVRPAAISDAGSAPIPVLNAFAWTAAALALLGLACIFAWYGEGVADSASAETPSALATCVAEFVGTYMLIFSIGCNVIAGDKTWGVTSIACTLMVLIYAFASVSGSNFNPAVSLALALSKKMPWNGAAMYICVQLAASIMAGLSYGMLLQKTFNLGPSEGYSLAQAGVAELLYTSVLCFVVLNTACSKKHAGNNQFYGLAIGFVVIAGGYGAGSISGGCFNPGVALAIDSSSSANGFGLCFVYFVFQFAGSALAYLLFRICRPEDFDEDQKFLLGQVSQSDLVSEFLGTFVLVLTVGLNVLSKSKAGAFSIAASLMCMIFALGSVSGAHFNPAVTMAIFCSGRGKLLGYKAVLYAFVQICAGLFAALTYSWLMNYKTVPLTPTGSANKALTGELLFTFLLSFVVLSVATVKNPLSEYFGLAIGACVIAGGYAIGGLSGGSLNPAVSAGLSVSDFVNTGASMVSLASYTGAELLGGAVAAGVFAIVHEKEFAKSPKESADWCQQS